MPPPSTENAEPVSLSPTLIVEDDPAMQERLRYVLSTLGCDENRISVTDSVAGARQLLGEQAAADQGQRDRARKQWLFHRPYSPA